jgi:hypothetical protein
VPTVKTVLLYGQDNPVDGAVLDVLIRKAVDIRRTLGVTVPVPVESESVVEAVLRSLFLRGEAGPRQLSFFDLGLLGVEDVHNRWDEAVDREKESRTRFAQHAIKPDEVARELEETDAALGNPQAVERFLRAACQRLGAPLRQQGKSWRLDVRQLPPVLRQRLGWENEWLIAFDTPPPEGATYIGRNHRLTEALVEYLLDMAVAPGEAAPPAARSAVVRADAVTRRTTLLLLRIRYLLEEAQATPTLAEECVVCAFTGRPGQLSWLDEAHAMELLQAAQPVANVLPAEREAWLAETLGWLPELESELTQIVEARAERLGRAHRRVRKITRTGRLKVTPQGTPDVLGVYVLMPVPKGVVG